MICGSGNASREKKKAFKFPYRTDHLTVYVLIVVSMQSSHAAAIANPEIYSVRVLV